MANRMTAEARVIEWNQGVVDVLAAAGLRTGGRKLQKYIEQELTAADRIDTGALRDSFTIDMGLGTIGPNLTVSSNSPYGAFVEFGTGPYIYPRDARVLRFNRSRKSSSAGRTGVVRGRGGRFESAYEFAPYVRGQMATHFFQKAVDRLKITDFV